MDFRILGGLEVADHDRRVPVRGSKPRTLLAFLLVHANRVVTRDRLVDALWDDNPPPSATATLHTYVSSLRKDLGHDLVRTRDQAYVLEVAEEAVDALRFERELAAVPNGASPDVVGARLGAALALWRGPALAEFQGHPWAQAQAARLEELRLRAIERRVAARLDGREHAALVPELEVLVAEHPLRERLWAQLMLALYGCDRQADALRAYGRLRAHLREELGIEPSRELQRLEASILRQDRDLGQRGSTAHAAAEAPADGSSVRNLPSPPTALVGRGADVDEVCRLVRQHRLVTLTGPGGCGKTRLAIEAARRLGPEFPDGVCFADLATVADGDHVTDAVARALGLTSDPTDADPLDRLRTYLGGRTLLCVLDNCEHVVDACARLADAVLTGSGTSRLLATSREELGVLGEQRYVVPPLDRTDAVSLFVARATEAHAGFRVDAGTGDAIAEVCERLDGIPLAIELAAARTTLLSPAQILQRLDDRFRLLTGASRRPARHQSLTATLAWSYDLLDESEKTALRRLAAFPASFSLEAAEAIVDDDDTVGLLGSLVAKSLVHTVEDGTRLRYRLLETVRVYAESAAVEAGDAEAGGARQARWMVDWLESFPFEERFLGDADLIAAENANIRRALEWSARRNDHDALARVAAGVDWTRSEAWRVGLRWCTAAAATARHLPTDLRTQLYVVLWSLYGMSIRGKEDWPSRNRWARLAVEIEDDEPSELRAVALTQLGVGLAAQAAQEALAGRLPTHVEPTIAGDADRGVTNGTKLADDLAAPWQMYCRLMAGRAYTNLMVISTANAETAEEHYLAGIAAASVGVGAQFRGLHSTLCGDLAILRLFTGDTTGARLLAREAAALGTTSLWWGKEYPLSLAIAVAFEPRDVARDALRGYDAASTAADWALGPETVAFYGGVAAAVREDWEVAGRLLGAGSRSTVRTPTTALLYFAFLDRVREAVGGERLGQLRHEGQAMTLADARALALR